LKSPVDAFLSVALNLHAGARLREWGPVSNVE
jgi:hypothetical protein